LPLAICWERKPLRLACRRDDGRTRLALWDADTDADWNKLQDAARLLAAAGYAMLLEPSPAARGGHLGTIFGQVPLAKAQGLAALPKEAVIGRLTATH